MNNKTDWLKERKWGVFVHYLYHEYDKPSVKNNFKPAATWDECVSRFDVKKYAKTLHDLNAGYAIVTLMQGQPYLCAPNAEYDRIVGAKPGEFCSKRDLIMEIADELAKYDIPLMLYYTGDGPYKNKKTAKAFNYFNRDDEEVNADFLKKWTDVLREYAVRYGSKVKGWWIDGMYAHRGYNDENMKLYKDAVTAGNPDAILALNNGNVWIDWRLPGAASLTEDLVHPLEKVKRLFPLAEQTEDECVRIKAQEAFKIPGPARYSIHEDFVAGEETEFMKWYPKDRFADGAQWHILSFLGQPTSDSGICGKGGWACVGSKYSGEELKNYIEAVNRKGGVVSVEIAIFDNADFDKGQIEVLKSLKSIRN